ncbi:efflux RND transporter periplasmic adaptor subunit [Epibacterium sp. Ofav1-8]|uniref:efflux RND transporter periplasmic adaptor subunit n=1 Tax=Epibacterium sp. Ofav1-8 TaxID=2917735 RepID=UPI001EF6FE31|nr:efflux RND transporter periplasmic adaptor subunit [Epibacterium sp. Ofav1-8]MCG7622236.1 efflux RND transporter periplasmic adaptor subunit [Epibacterium sp. Ofav1-8]
MSNPDDLETRLRSLSIDRADAAPRTASGSGSERRGRRSAPFWVYGLGLVLLAGGSALYLSPALQDRAITLAAPLLEPAKKLLDQADPDQADPATPATGAEPPAAERHARASADDDTASASAAPPKPAPGPRIVGSGFVVAPTSVILMSEIGGRVDSVDVTIGSRLDAGTPVLRLEDGNARLALDLAREDMRLAQARLDSARADHAAAAAPLRRLETLEARGIGKRAELEDAQLQLASLGHDISIARSQLETARLTLQRAQSDLEKHVLRAPFDAVVVDLPAAPGMTVSSGINGGADEAGLMELMDVSQLYVDVDVSERNIATIRRDQIAEVRLDAFPDRILAAQVSAIDPRASREKATIRVRLKLDTTDLDGVRPNMSAKATFTNLTDRALAQLRINGSN